METNKWMLDPKDAILLLIDHPKRVVPTGQGHRPANPSLARHRAREGGAARKDPDLHNGLGPRRAGTAPSFPRSMQFNPEAVYIPRTGQINAWDNPAWGRGHRETGRRTLLMAGTLTSVCMAFSPRSAPSSPVQGILHHRRLGQLEQDGDRP